MGPDDEDQTPCQTVCVFSEEKVLDSCSFRDEDDDCTYHYTVENPRDPNVKDLEVQVLKKKGECMCVYVCDSDMNRTSTCLYVCVFFRLPPRQPPLVAPSPLVPLVAVGSVAAVLLEILRLLQNLLPGIVS